MNKNLPSFSKTMSFLLTSFSAENKNGMLCNSVSCVNLSQHTIHTIQCHAVWEVRIKYVHDYVSFLNPAVLTANNLV